MNNWSGPEGSTKVKQLWDSKWSLEVPQKIRGAGVKKYSPTVGKMSNFLCKIWFEPFKALLCQRTDVDYNPMSQGIKVKKQNKKNTRIAKYPEEKII